MHYIKLIIHRTLYIAFLYYICVIWEEYYYRYVNPGVRHIFTVAYTTDRLMFLWEEYSPVEINSDLELPQFSLDTYTFSDCTKQYSTGNQNVS